ncbi:MAG: hypothetical protein Q9163_001010 [Psora crenata]
MDEPMRQDTKCDDVLLPKYEEFPPTPPYTDDNTSNSCDEEVEIPLPPPTTKPREILDVDRKTPDAHVPRDPRLIRLTGVHPFNVEAPLSALFEEGFLTSPELFYVRNHGAVPEVKDQDIPDWEISIEGLVQKPMTLTLRQLIAQYEQITCPITLVCAGNRRKEQNLVRKTKGFSWGAAGVSTALFTGVAMLDVIKRARPLTKARYVCMEGADKLPNGYYGTCVKLNWAMDPNRGILLAHKMNGEMLRPDHGRPLRAVIPGQIGGRSVKWLKKLIVTAAPSDNWYHIYDNRVLPTMVDPEQSANDPNTWTDERYAIYDLSVNSVIVYPAHEEQLNLSEGLDKYTVKGYAYSGGGRRVTKVEISLDQGRSWRLAEVDYPEDRYREANRYLYGGRLDMSWRESCFCWCHWSLELSVSEFVDAGDLLVRATDESMNVQPRDLYWSVLGMMNNPWFRIVIHNEGNCLTFEHPTQPALMSGGWMERVKKAGGNLTNGHWGEKIDGEKEELSSHEPSIEVTMTKDGLKNEITIEELRKHDNDADPWFVVNGEVYSGTSFLKEHPGGAQSIISAAGLDTSDEFMAIHSETAKAMMPQYHIGTLSCSALKTITNSTSDAINDDKPRPTFLHPRQWLTAPLVSKRPISADTVILTFKLQQPTQTLGLPIGQHLMIRLRDPAKKEAIIRSYTPVSPITQQGTMDVLVKLYLDTAANPGGKMSKALNSLPMGAGVEFKGPIGKFEYLGKGKCTVSGVERHVRRFAMICAGSGITPIFQVFRAVMRDREDRTKCTVLNGNRMVEDILCRDELEGLLEGNEDRGQVIHTLTKAPYGWQGLVGRINGELTRKHFPCDEETLVLVCGPEALEKSIHVILKEQGWKDEQILFF